MANKMYTKNVQNMYKTAANNKKQQKTKIHERGPGKSSRYKTRMDRNLFSPGSCSDHQFEPIYIYKIYKNIETIKKIYGKK